MSDDREPSEGGAKAPEAPGNRPRKALWKRVLPVVIVLLFLGFIFGWVLPQMIDYDLVWEAMKSLPAGEYVGLVAIALVWLSAEWWMLMTLLPGLSFRRAAISHLSSTAITGVGAPTGTDAALKFWMYRSWGFEGSPSAVGAILGWVFVTLVRLVLPFAAAIVLGVAAIRGQSIVVPALIGLAIFVVMAAIVALLFRSAKFTAKLGDLVGRIASWVLQRFGREPLEGMAARLLDFRREAVVLFRSRWYWPATAAVAIQIGMFLVLFAAMRFVGVPSDEVTGIEIFLSVAVAQLVTALPITPGGVGFVEVILIGLLAAGTHPGVSNQVGAAVFLYRAVTWILPIPLGFVTIGLWRRSARKRGVLPERASAEG